MLLKIRALKLDMTFSHMVFIFTTNITVKIGSNVYKIPTLLNNIQRGSGLAPINTSKNLPEKMGIERVQVEQPRRLTSEANILSLWGMSRAHNKPQVIADVGVGGDCCCTRSSESRSSSERMLGSDAGPLT